MAEIKVNHGQTLARVPIFSGLTESEFAFLAQRAVPRHFSAGETVFAEGEPCAGLPRHGHLDELFEALTLRQTQKVTGFPLVLVGSDYWQGMIDWLRDRALTHGTISQSDIDMLRLTDDVDEAVELIVVFPRPAGRTMMWFFAILIVLALGGIAVVASGRGAPMAPAYDDAGDALVPAAGPITADDLRRIRFPLAFRGYRMAEVDALLQRLAEEKDDLDAGVPRDGSEGGDADRSL